MVVVVLLTNDGDLLHLLHESREPPWVVIDTSASLRFVVHTTYTARISEARTVHRDGDSRGTATARGLSIRARLQRYPTSECLYILW